MMNNEYEINKNFFIYYKMSNQDLKVVYLRKSNAEVEKEKNDVNEIKEQEDASYFNKLENSIEYSYLNNQVHYISLILIPYFNL